MTVEDQYKGKNVNLAILSERIVRFFTEREFTASLHKKGKDYVVVATPKFYHGIAENINVYVSGSPDDFSVKFESGSHSRALVRLGNLLALLGGGFLALKGLKSQDELEELENDFWKYVDETVWHLSVFRSS